MYARLVVAAMVCQRTLQEPPFSFVKSQGMANDVVSRLALGDSANESRSTLFLFSKDLQIVQHLAGSLGRTLAHRQPRRRQPPPAQPPPGKSVGLVERLPRQHGPAQELVSLTTLKLKCSWSVSHLSREYGPVYGAADDVRHSRVYAS